MRRPSAGFQLLRLLLLLLLLAVKWGVLPSPAYCFPHNEVSALAAFKRATFEDPFSVLSDWNSIDASPCNWTGVICSRNQDCVVSLNLSGRSLKGFLAPELRFLGCLQELYLNNNLLLGTIPTEIGLLKNLTVLDLSVNRLTGPIPSKFGELTGIIKLDLHSNGLTGNIPPELGNLGNLVELRLDRNRLEGQIPGTTNSTSSASLHGMYTSNDSDTDLCQLTKLRTGDFSYNFLVGQIPSCLKYLPRSSFQGNCFGDKYSVLQRGSNKSQGMTKETDKQSTEGHKHKSPQQPEWLLILEVTTGVLIVVCIITGISTAVKSCKLKSSVKGPWKKTRHWKDVIPISIDGELLKNIPRFSREDLETSCEDFSNIIQSSPDSVVYKGTMKNGTEIAVTSLCILEDQWTNYLEFSFHNKVADLARLNHENIAKVLGYCNESEPFSRMLVILGVARGLRYLHTELQPPFIMSELSSNVVYLTEDYSPKLVDFEGWNMIFSRSKKRDGYDADEDPLSGYMDSQERRDMEIRQNVFGFGVLLLEIISGRPPYCKERGCLATQYLQHPEEIGKLVDPELENVKSQDLAVICSVVSLCIESDPTKRPSMQTVSAMLENGIDLSAAAILKESSLAWAELALSS
ncbi:Leucine rich repeat N-terminal domain [Musa troglodytarum]|uniref:Leucine rich repeat N-terminal domain n=1 Tax=Musa troglodytarum TaxID=320322 RepID=A0A9E7HTM3_9LILI|nr:Leucine rich repeat N-terminal domain [Musa troglodytarum]URE40346.1 Leucine rich repeat N-terminal domain [Musa troglodytarum]URE40349.1 Leucine rich repeat N-terminal domain [Musa troglodytarum]